MRQLSLLVEGGLDEAVGRRIVESAGLEVGTVHGKDGIGYIRKKLLGFDAASHARPVLVLVDLMDTESDCGPGVPASWLPRGKPTTILRAVKREIESWLLADSKSIAAFLGIRQNRVPRRPEDLPDPKAALIGLARRSRRASVRRLLVPREGSTSVVGPAYTPEMSRFVRTHWDLEKARTRAESLERCIRAVKAFAEG